jgi:glycosidase
LLKTNTDVQINYKPRKLSDVDFTPSGKVFPSPEDWRDQVIYFLLVDRFNDPDVKGKPFKEEPHEEQRDLEERKKWQGGNLRGVMEKLGYIQDLGATAIWLSPVLKNRTEYDSYHGYAIQNFLEVDPRFGTLEDLKNLIQAAHKRGMYMILDIVVNHTGDNWYYKGYEQTRPPYRDWPYEFGSWRKKKRDKPVQWPDDAVWPEEFQNEGWYKRQGEIKDWGDRKQYLDGDFFVLKELDTPDPAVLSALIDVYKWLIAKTDVDGFRVDAAKHIETRFFAIFCSALREYVLSIGKKNFFIFGEVVGEDDLMERYIGPNTPSPSREFFLGLDSVLDFPLFRVLPDIIKGFKSPDELRKRHEKLRGTLSSHGLASRYHVTFLDNHDQTRRFLHNDPYIDQVKQGIGCLLTSLGIPCIYYGTEQGFNGGDYRDEYTKRKDGFSDAFVRECMFGGKWGAFKSVGVDCFNQNHEIYKFIRKVADIRKNEPALRYGRQYCREVSKDGFNFAYPFRHPCSLAYSRILDNDEILVVLNTDIKNKQSCHITVDRNISPLGKKMKNLLDEDAQPLVIGEIRGRSFVKVDTPPCGIAILKTFEP